VLNLPSEILEGIMISLPLMEIVNLLLITKNMTTYVTKTCINFLNNLLKREVENLKSPEFIHSQSIFYSTNETMDLFGLIGGDNMKIITNSGRDCIIHLLLIVHMIVLTRDRIIAQDYQKSSTRSNSPLHRKEAFFKPTFGEMFKYDKEKRQFYPLFYGDKNDDLHFLSSSTFINKQKLEGIKNVIYKRLSQENRSRDECNGVIFPSGSYKTKDELQSFIITYATRDELKLLNLHKAGRDCVVSNLIVYSDKDGKLYRCIDEFFPNNVLFIGFYPFGSETFTRFDPTSLNMSKKEQQPTNYDEFYFERLASYYTKPYPIEPSSQLTTTGYTHCQKEYQIKDIKHNISCLLNKCKS
jgi:hypothetical protein